MRLDAHPYDARCLPQNYLPAAMEIRQTGHSADEPGTGFQGFVGHRKSPSSSNGHTADHTPGKTELGTIANQDLVIPSHAFFKQFSSLLLTGPACKAASSALLIDSESQSLTSPKQSHKPPSYVAVIDIGLVPWLTFGTTQFKTISHLDFETPQTTEDGSKTIAFTDWTEADTDVLTGPLGARMRKWVQRFPNSIYGKGMTADDFSHGIAMADLACRIPEGETQSDIAGLIGIELPARVLEDPSGGVLQGIMLAAIARAIALTQELHRNSDQSGKAQLEIVLAYAFTGGPHEAQSPIAQQIKQLLEHGAKGNVFPVLHIPMGNHQQQRLFARLEGNTSVDWMIPPGDQTPNTIEFALTPPETGSTEPARLNLRAPDGTALDLPMENGKGYDILSGERVIGSYHCNASADGSRLIGRVCLGATRPMKREIQPSPAGCWALSAAGTPSGELWIIRDDPISFLAEDARRKQTHFEHPDYPIRTRGEFAGPEADDLSPVKRAGSGSYLAATLGELAAKTAGLPSQIITCGAVDQARSSNANQDPILEHSPATSTEKLSFYSGITTGDAPERTRGTVLVAVDDGDFSHHHVQVAANGRTDFVIGTSVATALSGNVSARSTPAASNNLV